MVAALAITGGVGRVAMSADGHDAFSGTVTSKEEGKMEGVMVTARGVGANHTVSVMSGADGTYHFPKTHIPNGQYDITIRATGYTLAPTKVDVSASTKPVDLALTAGDVSKGMTSTEWAMSIPDSPEKQKMVYTALSCAYCHSYQRMMRAKHTTDQWVAAINRMSAYYPDGTASSDDGRGRGVREPMYGSSLGNPGKNVERTRNGSWMAFQGKELAEYLQKISLNGAAKWPFELKTLPRPKGKATKVIVTQWDMPRKDTVSHDSIIDSKGNLWYTDESRNYVGMLNPKTNKITEYPLGKLTAESLEGARDPVVDKDDNVWFPVRIEGGASVMAKFEPATQKLTFAEGGAYGQFTGLGGDGKLWTGTTIFRRIDPKTMKVDAEHDWSKAPNVPNGGRVACYQIAADSKGNPWCTGYFGSVIMTVDAKTGVAKFWPTPTPNAMPRRNRMDKDDRYWFAEYTADKVGMFDTKTEKFTEWPLRQYSTPYASSAPDAKGRVYVTSNMLEAVIQLDPKTGETVEFKMPTDFDSKKLMQDPTTTKPSIMMVNTRNARIVRVEPLD